MLADAQIGRDGECRKLSVLSPPTLYSERYLLYSALQIEEDTFWQSITSAGFSAAIAGYMRSIKALSTTHAWLSTFPASNDPKNERIFAAMSRAIKYRYLHQKAQNRYDPSDSDDSDY